MSYSYQGNRLQQVTDEFAGGFADGNKQSDDYTYDGNGNMISDKNKEIDEINYNFLNLPKVVTKINGDHINYTYTASGSKLSQVVTEGETSKTTDYAGPFIYEDNVLQFIQHAEGRITMKDNPPVYEYFLKDHLGNVRVTFTSKTEVDVSRATMEDDWAEEERSQFLNYDNVRKVSSPVTDKTRDFSGNTYFHRHAVRLSGGPNEKIGLAKSLQVMPGDKVHMEVYAKYFHPQDQNYWGYYPNLLMNALAGLNPGQIVIDGPSYGSPGFVTPIENGEGSDNEDGPQAYLRYIFVPKDFDFTEAIMQGVKVTTEAREINGYGEHEKLELDFEATEAGYLYAYFCNDREVPLEEVFFDEFKVEHEKSPIVQRIDYYPFGLTFNSYERENSVDQKFKFQGQAHVDDLDLGWDSFKWRNHMPDIGRFFGIDPLAEKYYYNSPYAFSENKVVAHRELEGLESESIHQKNYIPMAQDVPSSTRLHRNGSSIRVSSWNGKGEVVNSTSISLPSSGSQSQVSDHSAKTIGAVAMTAGEINPRISSIARDAKGQAKAMFDNAEKPGVGVQGLKNDYGAGGEQVADVYGRAKAMQGLATQFAGTVTDGQVKGMMENKINEIGVNNVTNHAADPNVLQVFDIAPSSITNKPAMMNAIEGSIGGGGPISKRIFPGPGRSEKAYHVEIPQPKK